MRTGQVRHVLLTAVAAALLAGAVTGAATVAASAAHPSVTTHHVLADNGVVNSKN